MNSIAEISRRLDNLLRPGTIAAVDHASARCRVQSGELLTAWLPWFARRAGELREWSPPSLGEQCLVLSPAGEPAAGFVLLGLFSEANPAPASTAAKHKEIFIDGAVLEYDHTLHHLAVLLPADATAQLIAPGGVTIAGNVDISGTVTVSGDVVAAGISLVHHKTPNIQRGSQLSDEPQ